MYRPHFIVLFTLMAALIGGCNGNGRGGMNPNFSGFPDTPFTIYEEGQLIGGPTAQGRIGDVLLANDRIRVIIQKSKIR